MTYSCYFSKLSSSPHLLSPSLPSHLHRHTLLSFLFIMLSFIFFFPFSNVLPSPPILLFIVFPLLPPYFHCSSFASSLPCCFFLIIPSSSSLSSYLHSFSSNAPSPFLHPSSPLSLPHDPIQCIIFYFLFSFSISSTSSSNFESSNFYSFFILQLRFLITLFHFPAYFTLFAILRFLLISFLLLFLLYLVGSHFGNEEITLYSTRSCSDHSVCKLSLFIWRPVKSPHRRPASLCFSQASHVRLRIRMV